MFCFHQTRAWQFNKILQTAEMMVRLQEWIPSKVILTIAGQKGDSNIEATLRACGVDDKTLVKFGEAKMIGATLLARAAADDAKAKAGSCRVICDGNGKALAVWMAKTVAGVELTPKIAEVPADKAEAIAYDANVIERTTADLQKLDTLLMILARREKGIYTKEADLPFTAAERIHKQNYWWQSEAVRMRKIAPEKVAGLHWKVTRPVAEGKMTLEESLLERNKQNEQKVAPGEAFRFCKTVAVNADPKHCISRFLTAACAGEVDKMKEIVAEIFATKA